MCFWLRRNPKDPNKQTVIRLAFSANAEKLDQYVSDRQKNSQISWRKARKPTLHWEVSPDSSSSSDMKFWARCSHNHRESWSCFCGELVPRQEWFRSMFQDVQAATWTYGRCALLSCCMELLNICHVNGKNHGFGLKLSPSWSWASTELLQLGKASPYSQPWRFFLFPQWW